MRLQVNFFLIRFLKVFVTILPFKDLLTIPIDKNDTNATQNAKKLYLSCIDEWTLEKKGTKDLLRIIDENLGGFPILYNNDSYVANHTIMDKLLMLKKIDSSQLFDIYISINPMDPKKSVIRVNSKITLIWFLVTLSLIYFKDFTARVVFQ